MPSSLKQRKVMENSAKHHADKASMQMLRKGVDIPERANEVVEKGRTTLQRAIIASDHFNSSGIKIHNNIHSKKKNIRREGQRQRHKH